MISAYCIFCDVKVTGLNAKFKSSKKWPDIRNIQSSVAETSERII